jgi:hypothetical protein
MQLQRQLDVRRVVPFNQAKTTNSDSRVLRQSKKKEFFVSTGSAAFAECDVGKAHVSRVCRGGEGLGS